VATFIASDDLVPSSISVGAISVVSNGVERCYDVADLAANVDLFLPFTNNELYLYWSDDAGNVAVISWGRISVSSLAYQSETFESSRYSNFPCSTVTFPQLHTTFVQDGASVQFNITVPLYISSTGRYDDATQSIPLQISAGEPFDISVCGISLSPAATTKISVTETNSTVFSFRFDTSSAVEGPCTFHYRTLYASPLPDHPPTLLPYLFAGDAPIVVGTAHLSCSGFALLCRYSLFFGKLWITWQIAKSRRCKRCLSLFRALCLQGPR